MAKVLWRWKYNEVQGKNITVSASFDSGVFTGSFVVTDSQPKSYSSEDCNIQTTHSLSHEDFDVISMLITNTIDKYLDAKKQK